MEVNKELQIRERKIWWVVVGSEVETEKERQPVAQRVSDFLALLLSVVISSFWKQGSRPIRDQFLLDGVKFSTSSVDRP